MPFSLSRNNRPYPPPPTHLCCLQIFFCSPFLKHTQHLLYCVILIDGKNPEYRCSKFRISWCSVTVVNLIISQFEENIVCVQKRVAATDREGREGLGGWWVLSYNWPLYTIQVIPFCSRLFCTAKYYHIIGPSIPYLTTFLYC